MKHKAAVGLLEEALENLAAARPETGSADDDHVARGDLAVQPEDMRRNDHGGAHDKGGFLEEISTGGFLGGGCHGVISRLISIDAAEPQVKPGNRNSGENSFHKKYLRIHGLSDEYEEITASGAHE